jgi:hypothetical protein
MSAFAERYWGRLSACMRWTHAEALAERVAGLDGPWYWAEPENEPVPILELTPTKAAGRFRERVTEMQRLKKGEYCNLIFADDPDSPDLVKLFHPRRAGDACRVGGDPIPPWGVLSRMPVDKSVFAPAQSQGDDRRLWQRVLRIGSG